MTDLAARRAIRELARIVDNNAGGSLLNYDSATEVVEWELSAEEPAPTPLTPIMEQIEDAIRLASVLGGNAFDVIEGRGLYHKRIAIQKALAAAPVAVGPFAKCEHGDWHDQTPNLSAAEKVWECGKCGFVDDGQRPAGEALTAESKFERALDEFSFDYARSVLNRGYVLKLQVSRAEVLRLYREADAEIERLKGEIK